MLHSTTLLHNIPRINLILLGPNNREIRARKRRIVALLQHRIRPPILGYIVPDHGQEVLVGGLEVHADRRRRQAQRRELARRVHALGDVGADDGVGCHIARLGAVDAAVDGRLRNVGRVGVGAVGGGVGDVEDLHAERVGDAPCGCGEGAAPVGRDGEVEFVFGAALVADDAAVQDVRGGEVVVEELDIRDRSIRVRHSQLPLLGPNRPREDRFRSITGRIIAIRLLACL